MALTRTPLAGPLAGRHAGHHQHRRLRRAVGHAAGVGREPADRGDVDDAARALGQELARGGPHAVEDAGLHDADRFVPGLVGRLRDGRADVADARVVDDDVEASEIARDGCERRVDLCRDAHVDRVAACLHAKRAQRLGRPLARGRVPLGDRDVAALGRELVRDGEAETGTGSRDDGDAPLKHSHAGERYGLRAADVARHDDVEVRVAEPAVGASPGDDEAARRRHDRRRVARRAERRRDDAAGRPGRVGRPGRREASDGERGDVAGRRRRRLRSGCARPTAAREPGPGRCPCPRAGARRRSCRSRPRDCRPARAWRRAGAWRWPRRCPRRPRARCRRGRRARRGGRRSGSWSCRQCRSRCRRRPRR